MIPVLNLPYDPTKAIVRGDTWSGFTATVKQNGSPVDITGATFRLHLFHACGSKIELTTGQGISIVNGPGGVFQINSINRLDWRPGKHNGDLEITFPNTIRITYCIVNITVTDDSTK